MRASVENKTKLRRPEVERVVWWTLNEIGVQQELVHVRVLDTDHWHHHGYFYGPRPDLPGIAQYLILAYIPLVLNGPFQRKLRGGPPPVHPHTWREALVCIVAHEATHVLQALAPPRGKGHRAYRWKRNERGHIVKTLVDVEPRRFFEVDAEWAEYRLLERWRERR